MSAEAQSNPPQLQAKLPAILDGISCVGALGGTIASLVTQQVMFATVPLSLMFAVQVMSRYKQQASLMAADRQSQAAIECSNQAIQQLETWSKAQQKAIHSLDLDTSHHCINVFELQRLIESKDQTQQYEVEKLSLELKGKLSELDTTVETIRAIVADGQGSGLSSAEVHYNRGVNQEQLGNLDAAIADYTQVIQQQGTHAFAFFRRGLAYMALGQKQAALLDLNTAARHFFGEGDLQNYEVAKEKVNEIHVAEQEAKRRHLMNIDVVIPASVNGMFGS